MGPHRLSLRWEARRLGRATIVGLMVYLAATGVLLPALAADADQLPASLALPEPRPGDKALYEVEGPGEFNHIVATWQPATWVPTADGTWIQARALQLDLLGPVPEGQHPAFGWDGRPETLTRNLSLTAYVDAATDEPVAWQHQVEETRLLDAYGSPETQVNRTQMWQRTQLGYADAHLPFGFLTELHGRSVPLDGPIEVRSTGPWEGAGVLRPTGIVEVAGTPTIAFEATSGVAKVAYVPGVPAPVRLLAPAGQILPNNTSQAPLELTLIGFEPAQGGHAKVTPEPAQLPTVAVAPREPWGPSAVGFKTAFTAAEAYRALMAEDGPRSAQVFLERHPRAYLAEADLHQDRIPPADAPARLIEDQRFDKPGDDGALVWRFYLTDGEAGFERFVVQENDGSMAVLGGQGPSVHERSEMHGEYPIPAGHHPPPGKAPTQLPVLAHLADRYRALIEAPAPDRWALSITCPTEPCRTVETRVEVAGLRADARGQEATAASQLTNVRASGARLAVDGTGTTMELDRWQRQSQDGYASSAQRQARSPAAPPVDAWEPAGLTPLEQAAGAGLLALLAAILYQVWPKLKIVVWSLYSRIGKDDLLENETRASVVELVRADPGIHFSRLREALEVGAGQLEHHLDLLVDHGLLLELGASGYRCYFEQGALPPEVMQAAPLLRAGAARKLLAALATGQASTAPGLADALSLSRSGLQHHVDRLTDAGVIERSHKGRRTQFSLTDLGRQAVNLLDLR